MHTPLSPSQTYSVLCRILSKLNSSKYKSLFRTWYNFFLGQSYFWGERPHASWPNLTFRRDFVSPGNVNNSTSLSSLSEQTIEKPCHLPLKLSSKPVIILQWQLAFQMGVWRQITLMFFANFPVSYCRAHPPAFLYGCGIFCLSPLVSLVCAIFLRGLDPCLAYKASSGYLLSFVLNVSDEKRQEVKELIELKKTQIDLTQSLHLSNHVPQMHPHGYFCFAFAHFIIFFLTSIQCFRLVFFFWYHKPILKESSLYAILWIGVYTRNKFTFPFF